MVAMKTMTNFDQLWNELESEAGALSGPGTLKRRINDGGQCAMFLGIRHPGHRRAFIMHVPKDIAPLPEVLPVSKGFFSDVLIAGDEERDEDASIILSAARSDYHEIFSVICNDLFMKLRASPSSRELVKAFLNRVHLWQIFFEKQDGTGLSDQAQKGLYGELHFLKYFLLPLGAGDETLRYWMGSAGRQHDFQLGTLAVEVKTSAAKQHQTLRIASEQQLDDSLVQRLYLFHLSVSLIENSPATLPALIDEIRKTLSDSVSAIDFFDNLLLERGFSDAHRELYERTGYSIRSSGVYEVRDEFPRITEDDLRAGVGDVGYSISLDGCSDYAVDEDNFKDDLAGALK